MSSSKRRYWNLKEEILGRSVSGELVSEEGMGLNYHVFICLGFVTPIRGICLVPTESDSATTKDSLLTTRLTHSNRAVAGTGGRVMRIRQVAKRIF